MSKHDSYRIDDDPRTISISTTVTFTIGHHHCAWCDVETPAPTDSQLIGVARYRIGGCPLRPEYKLSTIWPGEHDGEFMPEGWGYVTDVGGKVLLCPPCLAAFQASVNAAQRERAR